MDSQVAAARSNVGVKTRTGDAAEIRQARQELAAANLESYIRRIAATAPPLTQEQRDRLASLLRSGAA